MKTKLLLAYEPESSITIRLRPEEVAKLITKIPPDKFDDFVAELGKQTVFRDANWRSKLKCALGKYILRIEDY